MGNLLPDRLRLLRKEKKLTQRDMAGAILVPRVTYTHYELGKRTPDLDTILMLARFFGVSVDFLLGNTNLRPTLEAYLKGAGFEAAAADESFGYQVAGPDRALVADRVLPDK